MVVQSCPLTFLDWSSRASSACSSGTYHCVEDQYSRTVEVCSMPIWIEQGILLGTLYSNKILTFSYAFHDKEFQRFKIL